MTHIIGWKNSRSIFISGDSAITSTSDNPQAIKHELKNKKSTFGEIHLNEEKKVIQEKNLKLYNIADKIILGFAGSAETAHNIIDLIKRDFNEEENYEEIIKRALWSFRFPRNISLIVGFYENRVPVLLSYNHAGKKEFVRHQKNVTIGNTEEVYKLASLEFSNLVIENENELNDDKALIMVNSGHQAMIIMGELIQKGVGGFFTGFYINQNGVFWQKDTSYITFDINPEHFFSEEQNPNLIYSDAAIINLLIRDNRVAISSPYPDLGQQRNFYKNYLRRTASAKEKMEEKNDGIEWYRKWGQKVNKLFSTADLNFHCFLCKCPNIPTRITIVSKESNMQDNWFQIQQAPDNNGHILTPKGNFINEMKPRDSDILINFHWCGE